MKLWSYLLESIYIITNWFLFQFFIGFQKMRCTKSVKNLYFELLITCENMCNFNYSIFPYSRKFSLQTLKMGYLHCLPSQNSSKILVPGMSKTCCGRLRYICCIFHYFIHCYICKSPNIIKSTHIKTVSLTEVSHKGLC